MKKIFCIRHGYSTGDAEDRYGGDYDDDLAPLGLTQAAMLADELANSGIRTIYCSPMRRTLQTAQPLIRMAGSEPVIIADLRERNRYGALSGLTRAEARQAFPDLAERVRDRGQTLPGAESDAAASHRMLSAFGRIAASSQGCAAIVWHGGGMRALFRDYLRLGEVTEAGDCCWVELVCEADGLPFKVEKTRRLFWSA